jgi:hypothetical protein
VLDATLGLWLVTCVAQAACWSEPSVCKRTQTPLLVVSTALSKSDCFREGPPES